MISLLLSTLQDTFAYYLIYGKEQIINNAEQNKKRRFPVWCVLVFTNIDMI